MSELEHTDQPAPTHYEPLPPTRSRWPWIVGVAVLAVAAVGLWLVLRPSGPDLRRDPTLSADLITSADLPGAGYTVQEFTQEQLDESNGGGSSVDPDDVEPSRCGELLALSPPDVEGTVDVAAASAQPSSSGGPVYVEMIMRIPPGQQAAADAWDLSAYDELLGECRSITVAAEGQSVSMTLDELEVRQAADHSIGFVLAASGPTEMTMIVAIAQTGNRMAMLVSIQVGGTIGDDGTGDATEEFSALFSAAVDRALG